MSHLWKIKDVNDGSEFPIGEFLTLGSDHSLNPILMGLGVSPRHARIESRPDGYVIKDLRSTTGTLINGTKVAEAWIQLGDEIQIGEKQLVVIPENQQIAGQVLKSKNKKWSDQLEKLSSIAKSNFPVLILGETGVGKEVLAETIHKESERAQGPFVCVNCSALTETLVESELFGHVKGSFTGAIADRKGAFEAARGGTLFLDEIGDLPLQLQAKLLRALENSQIRAVGSDTTIKTDVRIVAATHLSIFDKIDTKDFRYDLYHRLAVATIYPPKLKDRLEDFDEILMAFARKQKVRFSFMAIQGLKTHHWPGNIRELKNVVSRAAVYFPFTQIEESHLPQIIENFNNQQSDGSASSQMTGQSGTLNLPVIKEIERQMIIKRLTANGGNQRKTADDLGMPKSTLNDRLKNYGIDPKKISQSSPSQNH